MVELLSEPLYVLAQMRLAIGLRVSIEAGATVLKMVATLVLLWIGVLPEAVALSIAQVVFGASITVGYLWHFYGEALSLLWPTSVLVATNKSWALSKQRFTVCCSFTGQAFEKLLLAEGAKMAMSQVQSAYDQGVYGLVVNLGSVLVRTLLQPLEEAAFMAFSRSAALQGTTRQLQILMPLVRAALLFGLFVTAFGPGNTHLLLRVLYGTKYSATEAPAALALYCPYILLLAANGVLECFVHAVSRGRQLVEGHIALITITAFQTLATLLLVRGHGTRGMIVSDALGMVLRIAYSVYFVADYASWGRSAGQERTAGSNSQDDKVTGKEASQADLSGALPSYWSMVALAGAGSGSQISASLFFGQGPLAYLLPQLQLAYWTGAGVHVAVNSILFFVASLVVLSCERTMWRALKDLGQKQD